MASDGSQRPSWYGEAFSYLPSRHRAVPHEAPPSAATAFAAAASGANSGGGYRSVVIDGGSSTKQTAYSGPNEPVDPLRVARTGTWDGPAPRGRGKGAAPVAPVKPAPASKTETSVSLGAGRKRLPLCGLRFVGEGSLPLSTSPLHVVVDADSEASISSAASALRSLSEQEREERVFLTLVVDGACESFAGVADSALSRLGGGSASTSADLVLLDWSRVVERDGSGDGAPSLAESQWKLAAEELLGASAGGRRRARSLGLAHAGLADVERLLTSSPSPQVPKPVALAVELHPLLPQRKLVGVCRRKGVVVVALNPSGGGEGDAATSKLLSDAAVRASASAEGKSPAEVLLRWSAERGIPFAASVPASPSSSVASVPTWALGPVSRDALDGAFSASENAGTRTCVARAGAVFSWPDAEEGGAVKASAVLLAGSGTLPPTVREQ